MELLEILGLVLIFIAGLIIGHLGLQDRAGITAENLEGDIRFDNVSFTYPDTGIEAIKNISFHLRKGEKMAIIGKTASGGPTWD